MNTYHDDVTEVANQVVPVVTVVNTNNLILHASQPPIHIRMCAAAYMDGYQVFHTSKNSVEGICDDRKDVIGSLAKVGRDSLVRSSTVVRLVTSTKSQTVSIQSHSTGSRPLTSR